MTQSPEPYEPKYLSPDYGTSDELPSVVSEQEVAVSAEPVADPPPIDVVAAAHAPLAPEVGTIGHAVAVENLNPFSREASALEAYGDEPDDVPEPATDQAASAVYSAEPQPVIAAPQRAQQPYSEQPVPQSVLPAPEPYRGQVAVPPNYGYAPPQSAPVQPYFAGQPYPGQPFQARPYGGPGYFPMKPDHPSSGTILTLGIMSIFFGILAPIAWIMGHNAKKEAERGGLYTFGGNARAGYTIGMVMTILNGCFWTLMFMAAMF